jgi:hypothetical protein
MAVGSHAAISKPAEAPERIAELNGMLWKIANGRIAAGKPTEHVAQAYLGLATVLAERAANGDPWLVKYLMAEAARELKIDFSELDAAKIEERVTCPDDVAQPVQLLFFDHIRTDDVVEAYERGNWGRKEPQPTTAPSPNYNPDNMRQRQELDRRARASPKEITARSKRLLTIADLTDAYDEMRRDDFCDVVAAAVQDGSLSRDAETRALCYREWVLSEADLKMISFVEWLEVDGRRRMQVLNTEWVRTRLELSRESADRHMTFAKWLISSNRQDH